MKRVMLIVAYDGTEYHGWQVQPNARTIEGELNRCLSELLQEDIQVIGASRTDAGVHAKGNIAVFDTDARMPAEKISYALNQRLPKDIVIQKSCQVDADFHPRHCDTRKTYSYHIYRGEFPMPLRTRYSYFTYVPLDVTKMREAAALFLGEHDFKSFCSANTQVESTVRTIEFLDVTEDDQELVITIRGNGFLYNMVRIIAGTLVDVGRGFLAVEDIPNILKACNRERAGQTLPACGLVLEKYEFL
ncbi:MAG: tRNA pseudouridine(38-40) synthase TruA [Clostridiales bacterium]|nr:tRNA pseudouridine(38-40) synthase TruA [Clostridiales bacterium]